jgi:hypothetical protein
MGRKHYRSVDRQVANCSEPEVGFEEIAIDLLQARFVDSVWFWQRSTCYSPKDKDEFFALSIHVVQVSTKSLKILIAALSSSVAY